MFYFSRFNKALLWSSLATCLTLTGCNQSKQASDSHANSAQKTVAITAIVEHPALDAVRKGVVDELADEGFNKDDNLNIDFQSAQGSTATAGQIAKQFVADSPNAVVAIATPSAQSMVAASRQIPVVFAAVTDPVAAKLIPNMDGSGTNVTGTSDALPLTPQVKLMQQIIPNLKDIGYVYSPGEVNSTTTLKNLKATLEPMGITVHAAPAQRSGDIAMAARSLIGKVDAIYTSTDNNVVSAYESLFQVAKQNHIPLIASDTDSVARGAVAALGVNYYQLGRETGKQVAQILNGKKPGDIPVFVPQKLDLYVSPNHAKAEGVILPASVIDAAKVVVGYADAVSRLSRYLRREARR